MRKSLILAGIAFQALLAGGGTASALPIPSSGLSLWLNADTGTTVVGGGDQHVTAWTDQANAGLDGIDNSASQGSAGARPTLVQNVFLGGHAALRFDGSASYMTFSDSGFSTGSGAAFTMIAYVNVAAYGASNNRPSIFGYGNDGGFNNAFMSISNGLGDPVQHVLEYRNNGGPDVYSNTVAPLSTAESFVLTRSGSSVAFYLNGSAIGTGTDSNGHPATGFGRIGEFELSQGEPAYLNGDVGQILYYNRVLSGAEIAQVQTYFTQTYAVPEPASLALAGLATALAGARGRRRRG